MSQLNALKIVASSGKSVELKEVPGMFSCLFEHKVSETSAKFDWQGQKMPKELWEEVLAFFKWTYDVHKSEAQVRLFYHPVQGWKAWAFPQKGATGMTTREEEGPELSKQRAEQIPAGYLPFGTVHHHCSIGAFQSGTDTADEVKQNGIHITVGKLADPVFDIHIRFYLNSHKFDVNMAAFWELDAQTLNEVEIIKVKYLMSADLNLIARNRMCLPPAAEATFNDLWRTNYIVPMPVTHAVYSGGNLQGSQPHGLFGITMNGTIQTTWCPKCKAHTADCKHKKKTRSRSYAPSWHGHAPDDDVIETMADILGDCWQFGLYEKDLAVAVLQLNDLTRYPELRLFKAMIDRLSRSYMVRYEDILAVIEKDWNPLPKGNAQLTAIETHDEVQKELKKQLNEAMEDGLNPYNAD